MNTENKENFRMYFSILSIVFKPQRQSEETQEKIVWHQTELLKINMPRRAL